MPRRELIAFTQLSTHRQRAKVAVIATAELLSLGTTIAPALGGALIGLVGAVLIVVAAIAVNWSIGRFALFPSALATLQEAVIGLVVGWLQVEKSPTMFLLAAEAAASWTALAEALLVVDEKHPLRRHAEQIGDELRAQYLLAYYPVRRIAETDFRKIRIELKGPATDALRARHRTGYFTSKFK